LKRQIRLILASSLLIAVVLIPIVVLTVDRANTNPRWYYYIEPGIITASEEVSISDITYTLDTYIWRDFMPISPPDGKPLIAIIRVYASGIDEFPLSTMIERLWLIDGLNIASTRASEEYRVDGNIFEMVFRDGPKWSPGISIDVVVKLISVDSFVNYLKVVNQLIHATF
jgi:hypothetical protein